MRTKLIRFLLAWLSPCLLVFLSPCLLVCRADFDEAIDSPMYQIPKLPFSRVENRFPEGAKALWLRALQRPEVEMKCQAAQAIAEAHRRGVKGMETTITPLLAELDKADQPAPVLLVVAQALIELDARQAQASLLRRAQSGGGDLRGSVEAALARWDYRPVRAIWLERLREPATRHRDLVLAIQGLATVREQAAADRLREMAQADRVPAPIRLESARALSKLRPEGLEKDAARLSADASPRSLVPRLVAASLLSHHRSPEAISILQKLAKDTEPTVAALAVARLLEIDAELLVPALEILLANPDAAIRSFAVDVLHRRPSEKHLRLLSERFDDPHMEVRRKARRYTQALAGEKKWREQIIRDATALLHGKRWRALEQATILLTLLDHKPVSARLVELLEFNRPEVMVAAAWGLRRLAVPETLPGVLKYIQEDIEKPILRKAPPAKESNRPRSNAPPPEEPPSLDVRDHTLSQLHQFLGQQKYRPAETVLRRFVPKLAFGFAGESRAAAIWALGLILEGQTDDALASDVEKRLNDTGSIPPEDFRVRWMCAITLGRLKAKNALPSLENFCRDFKPTQDPVNNACGWAIERITGKTMPPPEAVIRDQRDWFLVPDK
jgi:HEAT repeat protein